MSEAKPAARSPQGVKKHLSLAVSAVAYRLGLGLYHFAIKVAARKREQARQWVEGRQDVWQQLEALPPHPQRIWMHSASLGEFDQGLPVVERLKAQYPQAQVVATFFSPSGYEHRKNHPAVDHAFYLPMDSPANARRIVQHVQPKLVLWVKYEFWFYYLRELKQQQVPVLLVSGLFRSSQPFFRWWGSLHRQLLGYFTHFFVQDESSAQLLAEVGYHNFTVTGDTRVDRVAARAEQVPPLPEVEAWLQGEPLLIGGSTYSEEEQHIQQAVARGAWKGRVIMAPHHVGSERIRELQELWSGQEVLYSQLKNSLDTRRRVLIIDNVGLLARLYQYATLAVVGGGFSGGLHNVLEAAAFSVPVLFGPLYRKFPESVNLLNAGGAFSFQNAGNLGKYLEALREEENLAKAKAACTNYIRQNVGAADKVVAWIIKHKLLQ